MKPLSVLPVAGLAAIVCLSLACASDRSEPTGPATTVPIDSGLAARLELHVDDPFFQVWLPSHLGNQDDARPIHAQLQAISRNLDLGDATLLGQSLQAMPQALDAYRARMGRAPRDETILRAIGLCAEQALSILEGAPRMSTESAPTLSEDEG